jgi:hypothetical protein
MNMDRDQFDKLVFSKIGKITCARALKELIEKVMGSQYTQTDDMGYTKVLTVPNRLFYVYVNQCVYEDWYSNNTYMPKFVVAFKLMNPGIYLVEIARR